MGSKILTKSEKEFILKFAREAKSNKYKRGKILSKFKRAAKSYHNPNRKSYQNWSGKQNPVKNQVGSKILAKSEQEFLSKFKRKATSNKCKRGAKSYQNSSGKQNPIKIRAGNLFKIGAGSKIL
jgi:hypothetical protein